MKAPLRFRCPSRSFTALIFGVFSLLTATNLFFLRGASTPLGVQLAAAWRVFANVGRFLSPTREGLANVVTQLAFNGATDVVLGQLSAKAADTGYVGTWHWADSIIRNSLLKQMRDRGIRMWLFATDIRADGADGAASDLAYTVCGLAAQYEFDGVAFYLAAEHWNQTWVANLTTTCRQYVPLIAHQVSQGSLTHWLDLVPITDYFLVTFPYSSLIDVFQQFHQFQQFPGVGKDPGHATKYVLQVENLYPFSDVDANTVINAATVRDLLSSGGSVGYNNGIGIGRVPDIVIPDEDEYRHAFIHHDLRMVANYLSSPADSDSSEASETGGSGTSSSALVHFPANRTLWLATTGILLVSNL